MFLLIRLCRRVLCKMVNIRFWFDWFRQIPSSSWQYLLKVCLGLGVTLLAIRHWPRGQSGEDEEKPTPERSPAEDETPQSQGLPETAPVPGPELQEQKEEEEEEEGEEEEEEEEEEWDSAEWRVNPADHYYCEYDSTWDTEDSRDQSEEEDRINPVFRNPSYKQMRFEAAARDLQNYRHGYPNKPRRWNSRVPNGNPNLDFYLGKQPSLPDKMLIKDFHDDWKDNYEELESVHSYIQWLFPLQEPGVNPEASVLTKEEIKGFLQNGTARENLLKSYKLMLHFYGIKLCDEKTGKVKRASNWRERFTNLNDRTHNNLRITRILKCLGTLGFTHYQAPLVRFFLKETLVHRKLPNIKDSVLNYFLFAVRDKKQRRSLLQFAFLKYDRAEEFVWCPRKIQMRWSERKAREEVSQGPPVQASTLGTEEEEEEGQTENMLEENVCTVDVAEKGAVSLLPSASPKVSQKF